MDNIMLIQSLNKEFEIELSQGISGEELLQKLSNLINHLIQTDFQKLLTILYKTDISETKLKQLLQHNSDKDAAPVIANLIIEREQQKIKSRNEFSNKKKINGEEGW